MAVMERANACPKCWGCGKVANTDQQEPWTTWEDLPPGSDLAVRMGIVRPMPCPQCGGTGVKAVTEAETPGAPDPRGMDFEIELFIRDEWQTWWEDHRTDYPEGLDVYSAWEAGFNSREGYPWDPHLLLVRWLLTQPVPPDLAIGSAASQAIRWIQQLRERLAAAEARAEAVDELLDALRADPYFHGVWAWRQELQEGQLGYVRTPEVDRVLRAFAALGAYPATEPRT